MDLREHADVEVEVARMFDDVDEMLQAGRLDTGDGGGRRDEHRQLGSAACDVLEQWIEEVGDQGRTPEPATLVEEVRKKGEEFWTKRAASS